MQLWWGRCTKGWELGAQIFALAAIKRGLCVYFMCSWLCVLRKLGIARAESGAPFMLCTPLCVLQASPRSSPTKTSISHPPSSSLSPSPQTLHFTRNTHMQWKRRASPNFHAMCFIFGAIRGLVHRGLNLIRTGAKFGSKARGALRATAQELEIPCTQNYDQIPLCYFF